MSLIAGALLLQTKVPCWRVSDLGQRLKKGTPLPDGCTLRPFTAMGNPGCPVTVQTGWNDSGLAILVEVQQLDLAIVQPQPTNGLQRLEGLVDALAAHAQHLGQQFLLAGLLGTQVQIKAALLHGREIAIAC